MNDSLPVFPSSPAENSLPGSVTPDEVRRMNSGRLLSFIYRSRETSKQAIADALKLSMPTVTANLRALSREGLIETAGTYESTGGRKARKIRFAENARTFTGASLSKNELRLAAVNLFGEVTARETVSLTLRNSAGSFEKIGNIIKAFSGSSSGCALAIPGFLPAAGDRNRTDLPDSGSFRSSLFPEEILSGKDLLSAIPLSCRLLNSAEAEAMAELQDHPDIRSAVYLSLNRHFGAAVFHEGAFLRPSGLSEHMILIPGGRPCLCGRRGCAGEYCSAAALQGEAGLPWNLFFTRLRAGERECAGLWSDYLGYLAGFVGTISMLAGGPVILGGFLAEQFTEADLSGLRARVKQNTAFPEAVPDLLIGNRGEYAAAEGAALLPLASALRKMGMEILPRT